MTGAIGLSVDERVALRRYRRRATAEVASRWRRSPTAWLIGLAGLVVIIATTSAALRWRSLIASVFVAVVLLALAAMVIVTVAIVQEAYRSPRLAEQAATRLHLRRLPGARSHQIRSPRVGRAARQIELGYETAGIAQLEAFVSGGDRIEGRDAIVALADAALQRGEPDAAAALLQRLDASGGRWPSDAVAIGLECVALLEDTPLRQKLAERVTAHIGRRHHGRHDTALLAANALPEAQRLDALNRILTATGAGPIDWRASGTGLERLTASNSVSKADTDAPKVSVLVAMHNHAATIEMALKSLLAQSWPTLEIIVVDAASTDASVATVEALASQHDSLHLVRVEADLGISGALRRGLETATAAFITAHAPECWAHPDRIAMQMRPLLHDDQVAGSITSMIRLTSTMGVTRCGVEAGQVIGPDDTSLLLGRSTLETLGGWDSVSGETSAELLDRFRTHIGNDSVTTLPAPLMIAPAPADRVEIASSRHVFGARRCYNEGATAWHESRSFADSLPMARPNRSHPFFAPALIRSGSGVGHRDVVLVSDFALPGGTTASNLMEISVQAEAGLTTGLVHHRARHLRPAPINAKVRAQLDEHTDLITLGDEIETELVVVKYPPSVYALPDAMPTIRTGTVVVVANQAPWTSYDTVASPDAIGSHPANRRNRGPGRDRREVYRITDCDAQLRRAFGVEPIWMPVGPVMRSMLETHHGDEWGSVRHAEIDWVELIDPALWARPARPARVANDPIVIGRHGRDSMWKWPTTQEEVLAAYPNDPAYRVEILGGADAVRPVIGRIPGNWVVHEFDTIDPVTFLAGLDVFVNFVHPDMVEAFGRTILEALAAGVPVITDARFQPLFGDAVIGCTPAEMRHHLDALLADPAAYEAQVARGQELVARRFSPAAHLERLASYGVQHAPPATS